MLIIIIIVVAVGILSIRGRAGWFPGIASWRPLMALVWLV